MVHRMQSVQLNRLKVFTFAIITAFSVWAGTPVFAETNTSPNVIKVSPVRSDITVTAGGSHTLNTMVTNLTDTDIVIKPIINDFIAGDEKGTPALILDADQYAPTHSLKRFMKPLDAVTIPAKQTKVVEVVINVPADAQAGGYFGAVRFAPSVDGDSGNINMSASAASIILLTVPGAMVEKLNMTEFLVQQSGKNGAFFYTPKDIKTTFRFENKGNVQVAPFGKISIKNGDEVVFEHDFNTKNPREMILPNSARRWDVPFEKLGDFGHFTVNATFSYGSAGETIEVVRSFWIVPVWMLIAAGVVLLVLIATVIIVIFSIRRRKRRMPSSRGGRGSYRR